MTEFKDSGLEILDALWFAKDEYRNPRNSAFMETRRVCDRENMEMPFRHRSLYAGSAMDPFPVRIVDEAKR